jgi:two-component sensor histidine kinase
LLTVCDDGIGLSAKSSAETDTSLGLKLVKLLSQQLGGQLSITGSAGASFNIEFPYVRTV